MKKIFNSFFLTIFAIAFISSAVYPQKRAITLDDLWNMKRVGTASLSPDGKTIAFTVTTYNMEENKGNSDIYLINTDGSNLRPLKNSPQNEKEPRFSPDGKKIAYTFEGQVWMCNPDGSGEQQLTSIYTKASGYVWSPDGTKLLFTSSVYPDCPNDDCNKVNDKIKSESKVKASIFDELMFRHWDSWREGLRNHLFLFDLEKKTTIDLTLNSKQDVPPIALGSDDDYTFSPDEKEIAFTMNPDVKVERSTNNEIYLIKVSDAKAGAKTPFTLISTSKGNDNQPVYSPDGKYIAFRSMARAGFEADKSRIMLYNRENKTIKDLTEKIDLSAQELRWSPDSKYIYFNAQKEINEAVFRISIADSKLETVFGKHISRNLMVSSDGTTLYFKQQRTNLPDELFALEIGKLELKQLTFTNKELLDKLEMNPLETFTCKGADNTPVQSILLKPPFFDASKKYPMIFLIHGGPQGAWSDDFHYRWNLQMFAAKGYVVVAPNPRGSTGYGQKFTDQISKDWGGRPYVDLMKSCDYALKTFKFIDPKNTFAAGASYGGYMINWIAGHTNRFNALVSHDGVFNMESMYGTTDELWFEEWEKGGAPWQNRKLYEKFSPHRYIDKCKTPMLVVQGAMDFRISEGQAFELFTSLQRLGIESRLLYFPDETHFVSKPQNSRLWWGTVYDWFNKHKK